MIPVTYPPTATQQHLLRFILGYQLAFGRTPKMEQIAQALGYETRSNVHRLIEGLEERGHIRRPVRQGSAVREIEVLTHLGVPRCPNGRPLFFVPVEHGGEA